MTSRYLEIRRERAGDEIEIGRVISAAFASAQHSSGTEADIVERLREDGALALSLVVEQGKAIVGHVAFSPITIAGHHGWFGLGPVSTRPDKQGHGIGTRLIAQGIDMLTEADANGCVVLGDPAFYKRFGFMADANLVLRGVPKDYFQALTIGSPAHGVVSYHAAFGI